VEAADAGVLEIERLAFDAWPAAEVRALGGWRLRFNHGVTNRANSVWPGPGAGALPLDARIAEVERFYAERGAAACYQLSPAADPASLDEALAERGYEAFSGVSVEVADAGRVVAAAARGEAEVSCDEALGDDWFDLAGRRGRFQGDATRVYRALLERLAGRAGFVSARAAGEVVAVGLGVAAPPWVGVFSMLTLPGWRGRRLGEAVLGAIAGWALDRGAEHLYLQVEADNAAARALYARAGFTPHYAYHYRRQRASQ
jgi:GNAT superfamily N-acetyltransferase